MDMGEGRGDGTVSVRRCEPLRHRARVGDRALAVCGGRRGGHATGHSYRCRLGGCPARPTSRLRARVRAARRWGSGCRRENAARCGEPRPGDRQRDRQAAAPRDQFGDGVRLPRHASVADGTCEQVAARAGRQRHERRNSAPSMTSPPSRHLVATTTTLRGDAGSSARTCAAEAAFSTSTASRSSAVRERKSAAASARSTGTRSLATPSARRNPLSNDGSATGTVPAATVRSA